MPIDQKYGRVVLENPREVGEDEPVVVFRARDAILPELLDEYARRCAEAGSPPGHLELIGSTTRVIERWQAEHGSRTPSSDPKLPIWCKE